MITLTIGVRSIFLEPSKIASDPRHAHHTGVVGNSVQFGDRLYVAQLIDALSAMMKSEWPDGERSQGELAQMRLDQICELADRLQEGEITHADFQDEVGLILNKHEHDKECDFEDVGEVYR